MNRSLRIILIVGLMVLPASMALGSAGAGQEVIEMPTQMCRGYFFLPVTLAPREGYPEDRTLWFLHDTGASTSYVDPDSIQRVSGIYPKTGTRVNMRDPTVGPLKYSHIKARVSELDHLSMALGRRIDGILSFGAFKDFLLILDYQAGIIRLEKGELPKPNGIDVFSAKGKDYRPWMDVEFSGRTRRMLIDSGAGTSSLVVRRLDTYQTASEPRVVSITNGLKANDIEWRSAARSARPVLLGPHALQAPILLSTDDTEIVGGEVMKHFIWTFDQKKKRFRMTRNDPDAQIEFGPYTGLGVVYRPMDKGLVVRGILEDSPAQGVDIKPGDVVTRMDGKSLIDRGCNVSEEGSRTLGFLRDGQYQEISLEPYSLVP